MQFLGSYCELMDFNLFYVFQFIVVVLNDAQIVLTLASWSFFLLALKFF